MAEYERSDQASCIASEGIYLVAIEHVMIRPTMNFHLCAEELFVGMPITTSVQRVWRAQGRRAFHTGRVDGIEVDSAVASRLRRCKSGPSWPPKLALGLLARIVAGNRNEGSDMSRTCWG